MTTFELKVGLGRERLRAAVCLQLVGDWRSRMAGANLVATRCALEHWDRAANLLRAWIMTTEYAAC